MCAGRLWHEVAAAAAPCAQFTLQQLTASCSRHAWLAIVLAFQSLRAAHISPQFGASPRAASPLACEFNTHGCRAHQYQFWIEYTSNTPP